MSKYTHVSNGIQLAVGRLSKGRVVFMGLIPLFVSLGTKNEMWWCCFKRWSLAGRVPL